MTHLTLVPKSRMPSVKSVNAGVLDRPSPTSEFLTRRILNLTLKGETIGSLISEAALILETGKPGALDRISEITNTLMFAGVWLIPLSEDDEPVHAVVEYPERLAKHHAELSRNIPALQGLVLHPTKA